jgi:hypothetical protein
MRPVGEQGASLCWEQYIKGSIYNEGIIYTLEDSDVIMQSIYQGVP